VFHVLYRKTVVACCREVFGRPLGGVLESFRMEMKIVDESTTILSNDKTLDRKHN
jgi:hypothetical protein